MKVNLMPADTELRSSGLEARRAKKRVKISVPAKVQATTNTRHSVRRILIVDLNNFATFPTLAIGILVATLRNAGHQVRLMSPLAHDVPAVERERKETRLDDLRRRMHLSTSPIMRVAREAAFRAHRWYFERPHPKVLAETRRELDKAPDIILLSAYLQHFNSVKEIARLAQARRIPVLLGGPMFNIPGTADVWRQIEGVVAVVGADSDHSIAEMVETVCNQGDLLRFPGVAIADGRRSIAAPPLRRLDDVPVPDYSDFPWDRYPTRIIPMLTGRGCQWDKCLFCSDVISANGRTFRTKSIEAVLAEMQELSRRHDSTDFVFLDLKLNSYPDMIRGLAETVQRFVPGAEWVGTVHVDLRKDNGLAADDLKAAVQGGMRRISFGLESGSQRMLDRMMKGTSVEANAAFIRQAYEAGLSVRCSMFRGFPGETAEDMAKTADFLQAHARYLDRVRFMDFKLGQGTPIHDAVNNRSEVAAQIRTEYVDGRRARVAFFNPEGRDRAYRKAKARALDAVFQINRRHLRETARQFDGIM